MQSLSWRAYFENGDCWTELTEDGQRRSFADILQHGPLSELRLEGAERQYSVNYITGRFFIGQEEVLPGPEIALPPLFSVLKFEPIYVKQKVLNLIDASYVPSDTHYLGWRTYHNSRPYLCLLAVDSFARDHAFTDCL